MFRKLLLSAFIISMGTAVEANAQSVSNQSAEGSAYQPIFIKPYSRGTNTYTNSLPNMVRRDPDSQPSAGMRSQRQITSSASKQPQIIKRERSNPYAGTAYGRVRGEVDYIDPQTGEYVNQYEYMHRLSQRGNQQELNRIRTNLQQNGVFNPEKYQTAMSGGYSSSNNPGASGSNQSASSGTGTVRGGGTSTPRVVVKKNDEQSTMPQKIHRGYDDDAPSGSRDKNSPIFLR